MAKLPKELLGLAGEYAVASQLCRRGIYVQLTLGHHKKTDLLIESDTSFARIQVKAKQGREWPAIRGISSRYDFLVLVDLAGAKLLSPEYFILDVNDWRGLVEEESRRKPETQIDEYLTIRYPDGWIGLNVKPSMVTQFVDCWDKIADSLAQQDN